jgi:hypothetical protein
VISLEAALPFSIVSSMRSAVFSALPLQTWKDLFHRA